MEQALGFPSDVLPDCLLSLEKEGASALAAGVSLGQRVQWPWD